MMLHFSQGSLLSMHQDGSLAQTAYSHTQDFHISQHDTKMEALDAHDGFLEVVVCPKEHHDATCEDGELSRRRQRVKEGGARRKGITAAAVSITVTADMAWLDHDVRIAKQAAASKAGKHKKAANCHGRRRQSQSSDII